MSFLLAAAQHEVRILAEANKRLGVAIQAQALENGELQAQLAACGTAIRGYQRQRAQDRLTIDALATRVLALEDEIRDLEGDVGVLEDEIDTAHETIAALKPYAQLGVRVKLATAAATLFFARGGE